MAFILTDEKIYDEAATYAGVAEECFFEFSLGPEQIPGTDWFAGLVVNAVKNEIEKNGAVILELRIYRDASPTWVTNFAVEILAGTQQLQPAGVTRPQFVLALSWALIVKVLILVILPLLILAFVIKAVTVLWYGPTNGDGGGAPAFGNILGDIMPIMMMVLMMGLMIPMMSGMGSSSEPSPARVSSSTKKTGVKEKATSFAKKIGIIKK